jgi:hypothetical protein
MKIKWIGVAALLCSTGFSMAQNALNTSVFKPIELPQTIKPNPIPKGMVDSPPWALPMPIQGGNCDPSVDNLQVPTGVSPKPIDPTTSAKIAEIVKADQEARENADENTDWDKLSKEDAQRRTQLLELITKSSTASDYASIALVFQHGDCVPHYLLAHHFALLAMKNDSLAQWLVAATLDRALMSVNRAQKYGTQYTASSDRCFGLYVVDPRTTDQERTALGVPILEMAIARAKEFSAPDCP